LISLTGCQPLNGTNRHEQALAESCSVTLGSTSYDLSPLSGSDFEGSDQLYQYTVHLCGVAKESNCAKASGSICQYTPTGSYLFMISSWVLSPSPKFFLLDPTNPSLGVGVSLANGDSCQSSPRTVVLNVPCDPSSLGSTFTVMFSGCSYTITFPSSAGCPITVTSGSRLSGGEIYLIAVAVAVVVYLIAGCAYKRLRFGSSGIDACPNVDFWRAFPALVKDGVIVTFSPCCSRTRPGYGQIKD